MSKQTHGQVRQALTAGNHLASKQEQLACVSLISITVQCRTMALQLVHSDYTSLTQAHNSVSLDVQSTEESSK